MRIRRLGTAFLLACTATLAQDGPWHHRILLATSPDGLSWAVQNQTLAERASVPELFLDPEGGPTILFVDASTTPETIGAMQRDGQGNWRRTATNLRQVDPNVVRLNNGAYRAYVKSGLDGAMSAYRSADGLNWSQMGEVFCDSRYREATDPDAIMTS
ncbi:MAG: hypothetical protein JNL98_08470 [Bryobacterales bacterium]|nr:hypothetical protein [Bryobacterales bacterium]